MGSGTAVIFLAVDPGFKRMGWGIFDNKILLDNGLVEFRDRWDNESFAGYRDAGIRFHYGEWSRILAYAWKDKSASAIVTETLPIVSPSTQRALALTALTCLRLKAYEWGIDWHELSAQTIKKAVVGSAKTTKARVRRAVLDTYPQIQRGRKLGEIPFDETDGVATGIAFAQRIENDRSA